MFTPPAKTISHLRADVHREPTGSRRAYTPARVELVALPDWIKNPKFVAAYLTPKEARDLAIQLLQAASIADARDAKPEFR